MISMEERQEEGRVGRYYVMRVPPETVLDDETILMTLDGITWEKVKGDSCTCAKFKKNATCPHIEALYPDRKQTQAVVVRSEAKKRGERLKTAPASQLSKRSGDDLFLAVDAIFGTAFWYSRLITAGCLRGVATAILWVAKGVDPR